MFSFLEDIYAMSGLNAGILNAAFRLINLNNKCIYVEGNIRLKSISAEEIKVDLKKKNLAIFGSNLKIKNMTNDTIIIVGDIESMECN